MLGRRKNDLPSSESKPSSDLSEPTLVISKFKDITSMLLDAIRNFVSGSEELDSDEFKIDLDRNFIRIKESANVHDLVEIEEDLKKLLHEQYEAERLYHQTQYAEYFQMLATMMDGIGEFTGDNENFNKHLNTSLSQIGRALVEIDDMKQVRQQIAQRVIQTKKALQQKMQRDKEKQQMLTGKIEELTQRLNEAQEEILMDDMTQLYNRRAFDGRIKESVKRRKMFEKNFGLIMFDIDHFKSVNDTHGHQVGDRVLTVFSQRAKSVFRIDDFVARYGGEEFAVIIYCSSMDIAQSAANRLRDAADSRGFGYTKGEEMQILSITVSIGVAWCREDDTTESLIRRADECLYLAKKRGRNRVCVESELENANLI